MTWTSAFGNACGKLLRAIVNRMALARISPNFLTFLGLVIDTVAAFLFGYANADNQARMFFYAGLVIFGAGFFDLVDGRVARATATPPCSLASWSTTPVVDGSSMSCWPRSP
jgi:CDP-diacylglycerol--glycerol-3-phosphate 3-phosphatidyltransferase